jgi:predicted CxxxxCH...CXXCH cytochrome family protein
MSTFRRASRALDPERHPRGMGSRATPVSALALVLVLGGCTRSRDLSLCSSLGGSQSPDCGQSSGQHPAGWADPESADFHQKWLRVNGDKLDSCASCHGADYGGGPVGVSCASQGCHTRKGGPEFCGTCHGGDSGPLPATGAHALHASFCTDCHDVPTTVSQPDHITGTPRVAFSGLAVPGGKTASYDATSKTCAGVYCHAAQSPTWQAPPSTIACDLCHKAPPDSHKAWGRVANPPPGASPAAVAAVCAACHPVPQPGAAPAPGDTHVDGKIDFIAGIACNACHGQDATGAPPVSLDGSTDPGAPGVGAHQAHLQETLPGRIGHVVACATCHTVPKSVGEAGHLDHPLPATVSLPKGGAYDPATQTCTVWCHWDGNAGKTPKWTDTTGDIVAPTCTGCHGFPPATLRNGTPHTYAKPVLSACQACHPFSPATHVDAVVELVP